MARPPSQYYSFNRNLTKNLVFSGFLSSTLSGFYFLLLCLDRSSISLFLGLLVKVKDMNFLSNSKKNSGLLSIGYINKNFLGPLENFIL